MSFSVRRRDRGSNRPARAVAVALSLTILLAACGGTSGGADPTQASGSSGSDPTGAPPVGQAQPASSSSAIGTTTADGMTLALGTGQAKAGAAVAVAAHGLNPSHRGNVTIFVNLAGEPAGALPMSPAPGSSPQVTGSGDYSGRFVVPAQAQPGERRVCLVGNFGAQGMTSICLPFTVLAGPVAQQPTAPVAARGSGGAAGQVAGRYQCSSELLVGVGSQWCTVEPIMVLGADGTYSWGDSTGTFTAEPADNVSMPGAPAGPGFTVRFSGGFGGRIRNRHLIFDVITGSQDARYTYIEMAN